MITRAQLEERRRPIKAEMPSGHEVETG